MKLKRWKDISIIHKLYGVIGVMAVLIILELCTLWFAMNVLSAVRAFVGGEGLWSKAQKDAAFSLQRYAYSRNERDYQAFLDFLVVNDGDHIARMELQKPKPNFEIVRQGFLQGRNHPDDIDAMIHLLTRFHWVDYIAQAVEAWAAADTNLIQLRESGVAFHSLINSKNPDPKKIEVLVGTIQHLNTTLTKLEDRFSHVLGEGSRWLEKIVITLLSFAVLMVEGVGLMLAFVTSRGISRGLSDVIGVATEIGHGNLNRSVRVDSADEIGQLGEAINQMGQMLKKSYGELERRVEERTSELEKALRARDDFLSIASHELKTPLTSLLLQVQLRQRWLAKEDYAQFAPERIRKMMDGDQRQVKRLASLIDDMLDISRISREKLHLNEEVCDLSRITREVLERFKVNFEAAGCRVDQDLAPDLEGRWDAARIEQVIENLLTNAMKYGEGKGIIIRTWRDTTGLHLSVRDHGMGIAKEDQARIFMPFERAVTGQSISGLGIGLYIASEIVKLHKGKLSVDSQLGEGSTFTLSLPFLS